MERLTERQRIGLAMQSWHSSSGDPIYAVGSYYFANKDYPKRAVVEEARDAVESLIPRADAGAHGWKKKDATELRRIKKYLDKVLSKGGSAGAAKGRASGRLITQRMIGTTIDLRHKPAHVEAARRKKFSNAVVLENMAVSRDEFARRGMKKEAADWNRALEAERMGIDTRDWELPGLPGRASGHSLGRIPDVAGARESRTPMLPTRPRTNSNVRAYLAEVRHGIESRGWTRAQATSVTDVDSVTREIERLRLKGIDADEAAARLSRAMGTTMKSSRAPFTQRGYAKGAKRSSRATKKRA